MPLSTEGCRSRLSSFAFFLSISISFGMDLPAGSEAWSGSCDFELCEGFVFFVLKTTAEGSASDDDDEQVNLIVRNVSIFFDKNDDGGDGGEDDDHDVDLPLLNLAWVLAVLLSFTMMLTTGETLVGGQNKEATE